MRNEKGERIYSETQLRRLQRIRRLLDQGMRPGKLLRLSEEALDEVEAEPAASKHPSSWIKRSARYWQPYILPMPGRSKTCFAVQYKKQGMKAFILDTVVPLLNTVGELWIGGTLQVFQEHFLSQQLIRFLNTEIAKTRKELTADRSCCWQPCPVRNTRWGC